MSIRSDLHHDGDRCPVCAYPLAHATGFSRVRTGHRVDVLVWCGRCRAPSIVAWEAVA